MTFTESCVCRSLIRPSTSYLPYGHGTSQVMYHGMQTETFHRSKWSDQAFEAGSSVNSNYDLEVSKLGLRVELL